MAYVEVDVDLSDLETDELVEELCKRFMTFIKRKVITEKEKAQLKEDIQPLNDILKNASSSGLYINTLEDQMKYEHICNVWDKYNYTQLQNLIP